MPGGCCSTRRRSGDHPSYAGAIAAIARAAPFSGWEAEADLVPDDPAETAAILGEVGIAYMERLLAMDGHGSSSSTTCTESTLRASASWSSSSRRPPARSLVVIATMRPGPAPSWAGLPHVDRIDLAGLTAPETAQLATIVARAALDAQDAGTDRRADAGQPVVHRRDVRASMEDGTLELRDGRMSIVESRAPQLPLTLRAVLGARIDGLDVTARDVLGVGVGDRYRVPGRRAEGLLERPIPPRALERLVDAALVLPVDDGTWRFSHPLVHEAAYAGLLVFPPATAARPPRRPYRGRSRSGVDPRLPSIGRHRVTRSGRSRCSSKPRLRRRRWAPVRGGRVLADRGGSHQGPGEQARFRAAASSAGRPDALGPGVRSGGEDCFVLGRLHQRTVSPACAGRIHGRLRHTSPRSPRGGRVEWTMSADPSVGAACQVDGFVDREVAPDWVVVVGRSQRGLDQQQIGATRELHRGVIGPVSPR